MSTTKPRIAIDARMLKPGSMHGIARYVFHLLDELDRLSPKAEIIAMVNDASPLEKEYKLQNIKLARVSSPWISFSEQLELPRLLKSEKIDLFHAPSFVAPLLCPCAMVMTIHDLNHIVLSQFYTPLHQLYYNFFVRRCIGQSRYIFTVSRFSKQEIVSKLKLPADKVFVTYNGVAENYKKVDDPDLQRFVRAVYELPERFILCVSNNKPHKNVRQLIRAYCYSKIDIPLVLACPVDAEILRIAESFNRKHLIYFARFIHEEHLPVIYSMTDLFVYPSTYEGFGLPPLEALACGATVVVAQSSSLPEVVGNHALFADPFDHADIAKALVEGLALGPKRAELLTGVDEHLRKFSWREMALSTYSVYEKCLS